MVTGGTGYVAGWIIKQLLQAGVTVHAAVRSPENQKKVGHLYAMADALPGKIKFFKADLLQDGSYAKSMEGCSVVFHTASPFSSKITDPQKELVDPALLGTRNVLRQVNKTGSVKRVVLTSSCAAIYGDNTDVAKAPNGILTEEIWNESSSIDHQAYSYSKKVAEEEAWEIVKAQNRWDLVVINPSLVIGPGTNPNATSESFNLMKQMGDGTMKLGAPRWAIGVVDVREVATAHVVAAFKPAAKGRHILSAHNTDFLELGLSLFDRYGLQYPTPRRPFAKWFLWMFGPFINKSMTRKAISRNVNVPWKADNSKSIRELGIEYRPMEESTNEMFQQLIDAGCF